MKADPNRKVPEEIPITETIKDDRPPPPAKEPIKFIKKDGTPGNI